MILLRAFYLVLCGLAAEVFMLIERPGTPPEFTTVLVVYTAIVGILAYWFFTYTKKVAMYYELRRLADELRRREHESDRDTSDGLDDEAEEEENKIPRDE